MRIIRKHGFAVLCFIVTFIAIHFSYRELEKQVERMNTEVFTE